MGNSAKRDQRKSAHADDQRKALELRKAGATYEQIAAQLGLADRSGAWRSVKAAIKEIIREPAEDVLELELARLDTMLLGLWQKAKSGDTAAVAHALRIMERRASYLGIEAPEKSTLHVTGDLSQLTDEQLDERMREYMKRAGRK